MIRPEQYDKTPYLSQSDLKLMETNIQEFYAQKVLGQAREENRKRYFDVGDLIEIMYLQPELKSEFFTMPNIVLGDKFKLLMDELFALALTMHTEELEVLENMNLPCTKLCENVNEYMDWVEIAAKKALYYYNPEKDKPWSRNLETIQNEVKTTGAAYFQALVTANGKRVVNVEDWNTALKCVEKITTSNNSKIVEIVQTIEKVRNGNAEGIEVLIGRVLTGEINGVKMKGLLDLGIVNHNTKTVWPLDLKSIRSILMFPGNYRKLKYGRQGALYQSLLVQMYPGYKVKNFGFIAVGTDAALDDRAEYYEMSEKEIYAQIHGITEDGKVVFRGIHQALDDYKWHDKHNVWNRYPVNVINDDVFVLETFGNRDVEIVETVEEEIF